MPKIAEIDDQLRLARNQLMHSLLVEKLHILAQANKSTSTLRFEHQEQEGLSHLIKFAIQTRETSVMDGTPAIAVGGSYSDKKGLRKYRLKNEQGTVEEFERQLNESTEDAQTVVSTIYKNSSESPDSRDFKERASDTQLSADLRLNALREWIAADFVASSHFISSELLKLDLQYEWRRIVIYASEFVRFETPEVCDKVAQSLIKHAIEIRISSAPSDRPVVCCAIRRAGSLISESMLSCMEPLLLSGTIIDTRLSTLQAISSMFYSVPPSGLFGTSHIAERAGIIAEKHWDQDVFKAGEISAMAIEATIVATLLGSQKAVNAAKLAKTTQRSLLIGKMNKRLIETVKRWEVAGNNQTQHEIIKEVIAELKD